MKKAIRISAMFLACVVFATVFGGCQLMEPGKVTLVKKTLEERYGEKFEVVNTWTNRGTSFYASSYPVRDKTLVFESLFSMEKELVFDQYEEAIVEQQIEAVVQPRFEEIFEEVYVHAGLISANLDIIDINDITIEKFVDSSNNPRSSFEIAVNSDVYISENYEQEYLKIQEILGAVSDLGVGCSIGIHFLPEQQYQKYIQYFLNHAEIRADGEKILEGYPELGFAYVDGKSKISKEEYVKQREEQNK